MTGWDPSGPLRFGCTERRVLSEATWWNQGNAFWSSDWRWTRSPASGFAGSSFRTSSTSFGRSDGLNPRWRRSGRQELPPRLVPTGLSGRQYSRGAPRRNELAPCLRTPQTPRAASRPPAQFLERFPGYDSEVGCAGRVSPAFRCHRDAGHPADLDRGFLPRLYSYSYLRKRILRGTLVFLGQHTGFMDCALADVRSRRERLEYVL